MGRSSIRWIVLSLLVAGSASAKVMDTWTRISLQFTNLARAEASDTGIGVTTLTTTASGDHLNTLSLGTGTRGGVPGLSLDTVLPVTDPVVSNGGILSVRFTGFRQGFVPGPRNQLGVLGPISGAIGSTATPAGGLGTIPSPGEARICLLAPGCGSNFPLPLGDTVNGVAVGLGVGGILTLGGGDVEVSVLAAPYTVKTVSAFNRTNNGGVQTFTEKGFAHGPLSNTSSTGQTSGVLQVVTASRIGVLGVPGNSDLSGVLSRVVVHFVPEPSLLLLLGSGAIGMALLGRKRMRR